jgi:hypothetical protein
MTCIVLIKGAKMKLNNHQKICVIQFLLTAFIYASILSPAYSTVISSEELLSDFQAADVRNELAAIFDREDVQKELAKRGVDPISAKARINSMTDSEVAMLSHEMEKLPAGQGALGIIAIVLVIILLTEILGFTNFSNKI